MSGISKKLAARTKEITPFIVMEILERAHALEAAGEHVVHMEIGEPDFNTPEAVKETARRSLDENRTKYTHSLGLPELRVRIAEHYAREYGVDIDPERIIVTTGSSGGMLLLFSAVIDPGDRVLITNPCYSCYPNFIRLAGGIPQRVLMGEETGWQINPEGFRQAADSDTKAAVINSPANPTGIVLAPEVLAEFARVAEEKDFLIISDEIYHGMVYKGRANTILEYTDQAVVINSFSKLYAMTGWRLGWLVIPPDLVRPIQTLQQNLFISAPTISQEAALAALDDPDGEIKRMIALYDKRRQWLIPQLRKLGFGIAAEPTGAFYVLANAKHLSSDSYGLALEILEKAKVALTPGVDFGDAAEGYLRFSYANSLAELQEGCRRLEAWLKTRD
jgi:aspartate/methionine/tyrosine aminotransferase